MLFDEYSSILDAVFEILSFEMGYERTHPLSKYLKDQSSSPALILLDVSAEYCFLFYTTFSFIILNLIYILPALDGQQKVLRNIEIFSRLSLPHFTFISNLE